MLLFPLSISADRIALSGKERSEEHTSELQSRPHLVCRLLLEKKKKKQLRVVNAISKKHGVSITSGNNISAIHRHTYRLTLAKHINAMDSALNTEQYSDVTTCS